MTAEIAILNKSAVALAADSAVTISAGSDQQKIFDSEDKLFELSCVNPIGVMINSTMHFLEAPLPVLIKKYRETVPSFDTVEEAAAHFLQYLDEFVRGSPARIEDTATLAEAKTLLDFIAKRARDHFSARFFEPDGASVRSEYLDVPDSLQDKIAELMREAHERQLRLFERLFGDRADAEFFGDGQPSFTNDQREHVVAMVEELLPHATADQRARAVPMLEVAMRKGSLDGQSTGLVIAGYGSQELFPTLIHFELMGAFGGRLRFRRRDIVDIDRNGVKAAVMPFAQREMVERFLYGLDKSIEQQIRTESRSAVIQISEHILAALDMPEEDMHDLQATTDDAEMEFAAGLDRTFEAIRADSRVEIEDMVEFMPKPEMARMAEALVNLTSLKRRVSRGFETVGGPIDVAVISRSEGFVWVSRKHYFPRELNERYFTRMRPAVETSGGEQG